MNKTFKDFVKDDLNVFFNAMEFAEEHELNGDMLLCVVIDGVSSDSSKGFSNIHELASQEIFQNYKTVYVKSDDFYEVAVGAILTLNDEEYMVTETKNLEGVYKIVLMANEN